MITFKLIGLDEEKFYWLFKNVGHGGSWLINHANDGEVEVEDGDAWGYYFEAPRGWYRIGFLDEKKAMLYSLRWL